MRIARPLGRLPHTQLVVYMFLLYLAALALPVAGLWGIPAGLLLGVLFGLGISETWLRLVILTRLVHYLHEGGQLEDEPAPPAGMQQGVDHREQQEADDEQD